MSLYEDPPPSRGPTIAAVAVAVLAIAGALAWFVMRPAPPAPKTTAPSAAPREARSKKPTPLPSTLATPRPYEAPVATTGARLRVVSDVPGASVFLDRKFVGHTPLDIPALEPGPHRLQASADGYDTQSRDIDGASAPREVTFSFKQVSLDASVPVVHKHGVGSCKGTLRADTSGLRYETSHKDAFRAPHADVAELSVDYLQKNLRVKLRGGRTFNFTHPGGEADPLLVFQREVERARTRLAGR